MKKKDIKIGQRYCARVSGKLVSVLIEGVNPNLGWYGRNLDTGRTVHIRSAQRLRWRVDEDGHMNAEDMNAWYWKSLKRSERSESCKKSKG